MKDEFYIVLPSNSSMNYFSENTTSHFITQLPQQIRLQGSWSVALTEVQIPLTFQHVSSEVLDRTVSLTRISHSTLLTNQIRAVNFNAIELMVRPGIYKDIHAIVSEINNLNCTKKCYIEYKPNSIGYSGILRHACDCANALRTVGSCSHIAVVIYYLSNARYKSKIIRPAKVLSELFTTSDIDPVIDEDSDED